MSHGFDVVEDHNVRKGDMSLAEIEQCMVDLKTWWDNAAAESKSGDGEGKSGDGVGENVLSIGLTSPRTTLLRRWQP